VVTKDVKSLRRRGFERKERDRGRKRKVLKPKKKDWMGTYGRKNVKSGEIICDACLP